MKSGAALILALLALAGPYHARAQSVLPGLLGRAFTLEETMAVLDAAAGGRGVFRWDPFLQEGSFAVGGHYGAFHAASFPGQGGFLLLNNRDLHPVTLPFIDRGELVFPEAFVTAARDVFAGVTGGHFHYRIAAIVIDPGHGGRDPGAVFYHTINGQRRLIRESDIALRSSVMLRDMLEARFPDKRILMTRERDIHLSLEERTEIANAVPVRDREAVIFVSMHANYATNRNARGFEVWHITQNYRRELLPPDQFPDSDLRNILNLMTEESFRNESIMVAQAILDGLQERMGPGMPNRGLRAENWFVVRRSNMPAVLVELGFVTNLQDALLMTEETSLRRLVEGVYAGIADFVAAFERSGGFITAQ